MLIDVSDTNTIPVDIEKKIIGHFSLMPESAIADIKNQKPKYDRDVLCAIEKHASPYAAYGFYQELIALFEQYEMVCYHSTKIINIRDYATLNQLLVLANMESYNAILIEQEKSQPERLVALRDLAVRQMQTMIL